MTWKHKVAPRDRRDQSRHKALGRLVHPDRAGLERLEDRTLLAANAAADAFGLIENNPLNVAAPGLLANDVSTVDNPLTVSAFTQPANGTVAVNPDGSFVFTPGANFTGATSFTYTLSDGTATTDTETVTLNVAATTPLATVFAGSRLASVDSSQGPLLDALTSSLLGSSLSLNVLDWNGLAGGDINVASLLNVLQTDLGVSSPSEVLTTDATVVQILTAAATVAQADGNTALVNALDSSIAQLGGLTGTIQLGDLLQLDPNSGSLSDVDLNALDLLTGVVQLYNFDNVATTPTPVTISGATLAGLGLPATVGSLELSAQVVEPPIFVRGPEGTQFHTAAVRLKLDLNNLVGLDLDTSGLIGAIEDALGVVLPNLVTATADVSNLAVYAEVASTNGTIQTIDALTAAVGVQATPGVTNLYIGTIADSVFFDRTHTIDPATDLTAADVGTLTITGPLGLNVSAAIQLRDFALGEAPGSPTLLNFVPPYPSPTQTVGSSSTAITALTTDLVNNLEVSINGTLGPVLDQIVGTLTAGLVQPVVNGILTPIVTPLLTGVVDPLLGLLGVGIGESIVAVDAVGIDAAPIANPDFANTDQDTPVIIPVLNNDAFTPGDTLTISSVTQGANGTVTINADGTLTYTPNAGFTGSDTFTYIATNGTLLSNSTTVTINVLPPGQQAPTAVNDAYTTTGGTTLTVPASGVLLNDVSPSGAPLTAAVVGQPANGTLTLNPDGSFSYIPNAGFVGTDSFTYQASDGTFVSNPATVTITVQAPPVQAPTAVNDQYVATTGTTLTIAGPGVLGNDVSPNGTPLTAQVVSQPTNGTLTLNPDGSFTYIPNVGFVGVDSFTYQNTDGTTPSNTATVAITVQAEPTQAPIAVNDQYATTEGGTLTVAGPGVLGNDVSPNGTPLTAQVVTQPANGTLTLNPDGSFTYVPNAGFVGADSFTYRNTDGTTPSNTATVAITVQAQAPIAVNDQYLATSGTTLTVAGPGVLANDVSPNGTPLTAQVVSQPTNGTLTLNPDGSFTYIPNVGFVGADSFTYQNTDGTTASNTATVAITVQAQAGQAPTAVDDQYVATEGGTLTIPSPGVLGNDVSPNGTPLTAQVVTQPANGTLTLNPDGSFTYVPNAGFAGVDSFTYQNTDGTTPSNTATVAITVQAQPAQAPTAVNDQYVATEGGTLTIVAPGVLSNDISPNGTPLTAQVVTQPANGTLTLNPDGSFTYVPNAGFVGVDSFTYRNTDGTTPSNTATVAITVQAQPAQAPIAVNDQYVATEGGTLNIPAPGVLGNDVSPNGTPLTAQVVSQPANGTLTLNPDGSFTYVPNAGFVGVDSFTYQNTDGTTASNTATVAITVQAQPAQAPTAVDDQFVATEGGTLNIPVPGVLGNDVSPGGTPLTAQVVNGPTNGTLTLNPDGSFTYVPNPGFIGTDQFTYRNTDGTTFSNTATVAIAVLPDNAQPQPLSPEVVGLQRFGVHDQTTLLVLSFSQDLDPVRAQNPANYILQSRGRDGRLGTRDDVFISIASATYDPANRTVTLVATHRLLKLREHYRLTVIGTGATGLTGVTGVPLAGIPGQPGTNFVARFNKNALVGVSDGSGVEGTTRAARRQAARARLAANRLLRQTGGARTLGRLQARPHGGRPHA